MTDLQWHRSRRSGSVLVSDDRRFTIVGPLNERGGYQLYDQGAHVWTGKRQARAKAMAEMIRVREAA